MSETYQKNAAPAKRAEELALPPSVTILLTRRLMQDLPEVPSRNAGGNQC